MPDPATFVREALLSRIYCRGNIPGCFIIRGAHFNNNLAFRDLATARDDIGDFNEMYKTSRELSGNPILSAYEL